MNHLTDEIINEYLDDALSAPGRAAADGHLSACPDCRARLEALRGLFVELERLPDVGLAHDLVPGVLAALEKRVGVPRAVRLLVFVQALAAVSILALAWPVLQLGLAAAGLSFPASPVFPSASEMTGRIVRQSLGWVQTLTQPGSPAIFRLPLSIQLDPPAVLITLTLVSACLLWLVGNGLLLWPQAGSYKRRHS